MNKFFEQILEALEKKNTLYFRVKVLPKAPVTDITDQIEDGTYKISVAAPATDNKANAELLKFLKKALKAEATIISGQTGRVKLVKLQR